MSSPSPLQINLRHLCKPGSPQKPRVIPFSKILPKLTQAPFFYGEVDMSDLASQYTEDKEIFMQILKLPDPRDNMPMSLTTV